MKAAVSSVRVTNIECGYGGLRAPMKPSIARCPDRRKKQRPGRVSASFKKWVLFRSRWWSSKHLHTLKDS